MADKKTPGFHPEPGDYKAVRRGSSSYERESSALEEACFSLRQYPVEEVSGLLGKGRFEMIVRASFYQKLGKILYHDQDYLSVIRAPENLVKRAVLNGLGVTLLVNHQPQQPHVRLLEPLVFEISNTYETIETFVYEREDNLRMTPKITEMFLRYTKAKGYNASGRDLSKKDLFQTLCFLLLADSLVFKKRKYDRSVAVVLDPIISDLKKGRGMRERVYSFVFDMNDREKICFETYQRFVNFMGELPVSKKTGAHHKKKGRKN